MSAYDVRDVMKAEAADTAGGPASPQPPGPRTLSPLAERIAAMVKTPPISPVVIAGAVRLIDLATVLVVGFVTYHFYLARPLESIGVAALPIVGVVAVLVFQALGVYEISVLRQIAAGIARVASGWILVFLFAVTMVFFAKVGEAVSRVWLGSWFVLGLGVLLGGRALIAVYVKRLTRSGRLDRRAAVVGGGPAGEGLVRALDSQPDTGIRICGVFDDRDDARSPNTIAGYPKLGTVDDLVAFARKTRLDLVIFTLPITAEERILAMLRKLWVLPIDIRLSAHSSKLKLRPRSYSYLGSVPVLDVFDRPIADGDLVVKWLFDKIVGALLIVLLSPLFLATALAVKLDSPGPAFFRQKRYGFNNDLIEVFKFRSMYVGDADTTASRLVTRNDPRVTRVGRFIRKASLDELPQLFNVVFRGNLSLVGPRPHAIHAKAQNRLYDDVVDGYFARHKVKPGITGWAQINGWRGETDTEEKIQRRVEHDLHYIENWSVLFDLTILATTPFALLKTENSY